MLLYKTTHDTNGLVNASSFQGSLTEASKARTALKGQGFKPATQTIEVPTNKAGLLEWLNANAA